MRATPGSFPIPAVWHPRAWAHANDLHPDTAADSGLRRLVLFSGCRPRRFSPSVVVPGRRHARVVPAPRRPRRGSCGLPKRSAFAFPQATAEPDITAPAAPVALGRPLLRFGPLQRFPAAMRCPGRPASGQSRFGVARCQATRAFADHRFDNVALAVFRLADAMRRCSMRGRFAA